MRARLTRKRAGPPLISAVSIVLGLTLIAPSALADGRYNFGVSGDCTSPAEVDYNTEFHVIVGSPRKGPPITPVLAGLRVSNPCDQALQVLILTFDDIFIVLGVAPGVEATTSTADLAEVGMRLFPTAGVGGVNSSSPDPCAFSPDLMVNQDGSLSPATC
ncbi:MAG TPA: hypothetical protein VFH69_00410 [Gemmatimonadota bacterium]|nr:hypothetical protein [Gemmatimonadota bacterium]